MYFSRNNIILLKKFLLRFLCKFPNHGTNKGLLLLLLLFKPARGEERGAVDRARGHPVPPLLLGLRRLELRHRHVGGHVLRREALLGHGQPGRKSPVWSVHLLLHSSLCQWTRQTEPSLMKGSRKAPVLLPSFFFFFAVPKCSSLSLHQLHDQSCFLLRTRRPLSGGLGLVLEVKKPFWKCKAL